MQIISFVIFLPLFRDRSLFMAGDGAEEKPF